VLDQVGQYQRHILVADEIQVEQPDEQDGQAVGNDPHDTETDEFAMGSCQLLPVKCPDFVEDEAEQAAARPADKIGGFR